jgi:hypothetical protein
VHAFVQSFDKIHFVEKKVLRVGKHFVQKFGKFGESVTVVQLF